MAKPICLTGHLDTVPLGTASWSVDPFAGDIVEGKLFGRGWRLIALLLTSFPLFCLAAGVLELHLLTILGVGLIENDAGLAAAVLFLSAFTIALSVGMALRPLEKGRE